MLKTRLILSVISLISLSTKGEDLQANSQADQALSVEPGFSIETLITADWVANVSGGLSTGSRILTNFDLIASFNTQKWVGGRMVNYVLMYWQLPGVALQTSLEICRAPTILRQTVRSGYMNSGTSIG
jgi:hypothetical protein